MAQQVSESVSNSKRYSCEFCKDTFAHRSGLSRHLGRKHKDEIDNETVGHAVCSECTGTSPSRYKFKTLQLHVCYVMLFSVICHPRFYCNCLATLSQLC